MRLKAIARNNLNYTDMYGDDLDFYRGREYTIMDREWFMHAAPENRAQYKDGLYIVFGEHPKTCGVYMFKEDILKYFILL